MREAIAYVRRLCRRATPAPWGEYGDQCIHGGPKPIGKGGHLARTALRADAHAIALQLSIWKEALAVIEAVLIDHDQSIGPEEHEEGVKQWWKMPATKVALDAYFAAVRAHQKRNET